MPFGWIFAALVFIVLAPFWGMRLVQMDALVIRIAGGAMLLLGPTMTIALLMRLRIARWVGIGVGLIAALWTLMLALSQGGIFNALMFLSTALISRSLGDCVSSATGGPSSGTLQAESIRQTPTIEILAIGFDIELSQTGQFGPAGPTKPLLQV